jgi:alpha-glucosidase (family GH31 glycosyl hydrolase)
MTYIYTTLSREGHRPDGLPVARTLLTEFPNDTSSEMLEALDCQFMLGPCLLVSPVLDPLAGNPTVTHHVYLTKSNVTIYDFYSGQKYT